METLAWIVVCINLVATIFAIRKNPKAFYLYQITNCYWIYYTFHREVYPMLAVQAIYFVLNIWGIKRWTREKGGKNGKVLV